jgi:predicted DNA-binding transcriptional regulator AlpA
MAGTNTAPRMTLAQARAVADRCEAERDDYEREPHAEYYRSATRHEVIDMWESGRGTDGKRLKRRELACLVERWVELFGTLPPDHDGRNEDNVPTTPALPPDDTTLPAKEVERLLGVSKSTLKRMVKEGRFPPARRTGIRTRGWPARDVRNFIETLDEQRRRPRQ